MPRKRAAAGQGPRSRQDAEEWPALLCGRGRKLGKLGMEVQAFLCIGDLVLFLKSGKAAGFVIQGTVASHFGPGKSPVAPERTPILRPTQTDRFFLVGWKGPIF